MLPLGDEQYTLILNVKCSPENCPKELRTFYAYLKDGVVAEDDEMIQKIHHKVERVNRIEQVQNLMTMQEEMDRLKKREAERKKLEQWLKEAEAKVLEVEAENRKLKAQLAEMEAQRKGAGC